jgi:hypothetical protein
VWRNTRSIRVPIAEKRSPSAVTRILMTGIKGMGKTGPASTPRPYLGTPEGVERDPVHTCTHSGKTKPLRPASERVERGRVRLVLLRRPDRAVLPLDLPHLTRRDTPDTDPARADDIQGRPKLQARPGGPHRLGVDVNPSAVGADDDIVAGRPDRRHVIHTPR